MDRFFKPTRFRAFLIHLIGSLILAAGALVLVFLVWYPSPLAQVIGVTHIFLLMLSIDVIVGPLFTLLVYKTGKKTLKFDLTLIVIIQLALFSYGLQTVALGRPAWLVFSVDQFYLVRAADINGTQAKSALSQYQQTPWFGPKWATTHLPEDKIQRRLLINRALHEGESLFANSSLYQPLDTDRAKVQSKLHELTELNRYNNSTIVKSTLSKWPTANAWLPLWSDHQSATVLMDKNTKVVSIVNLKPWVHN